MKTITKDDELNALLYKTLSGIVPDVWEGVYTGEDVDKYITFVYYTRGTFYANDRPTAKTWRITVTMWARNGVPVYKERTDMKLAVWKMCGSYPQMETATDNGWQQYIFEFSYTGGIEEEVLYGEDNVQNGGRKR